MATYNGEAYLKEQLDSVASQTCLPDELIISDDHSTDGTVEIAKAFSRHAAFPVTLFEGQQNRGYAKNFIFAIGHCSGDLIMPADQDDLWTENKIERLVQNAACCSEQVFSHDIEIFSEPPKSIFHQSYYHYLRAQGFAVSVNIKGCSMAVRRSFIEAVGWPPPSVNISHDVWLNLLATALGTRLCIEEQLLKHRLHQRNTSGWIPSHADLRTAPTSFQSLREEFAMLIELYFPEGDLSWAGPFMAALRKAKSPRARVFIHLLEENQFRYAWGPR
jgi:glycosyltransferase involved in cell wall biosynthesis